jgi:uncharacterized protein (TIGR02996 family)
VPAEDQAELALIRAIYEADPDDDEPRFIYADYLQQRGDPRGELIALQCRAARDPNDEVAHRALNLFDVDESRWLGAWHGEAIAWRFHKGFVHQLTIPIDSFVILGELLLSREPFPHELVHLRSLELRESRGMDDPSLSSLVAILERLRLHTLSLQLLVGTDLAHALASSAALAHLTTLRLSDATHDRDVPAMLCRGMSSRFDSLELVNCHLTRSEATSLASAARFAQVRRLDLTSGGRLHPNELGIDGIVELLTSNSRLTSLELHGNRYYEPGDNHYTFGERVVRDVLGQTQPPLVELGLSNTVTTTDDLAGLARIATLQRLDLRGNWIEDPALDTLLGLPNLTTLNIAHTRISAVGAQRIVHEAPPSLRELTLTVPGLSDALVVALRARFTLHRWR